MRRPEISQSKIKVAPQRLVIGRLIIDIMRNLHVAYAPAGEPFGSRLEIAFIALCVAVGDIEGFCYQDRCLYAGAPYYGDAQAQ